MPDADALVRLADALDTTVETLLGAPIAEASDPAAAPDIAQALGRINDQLVIQNRRRRRIWQVVAWSVGILLAMQVLLIVLGAAVYGSMNTPVEVQNVTNLLEEPAP